MPAPRFVGSDLVEVEYDPLPAVIDPETAAAPEAPQLYAEAPGNVVYEFAWSAGDVEAALARAHRVVRCRRSMMYEASGRPVADLGARAVGLDPVEIRRRNLVRDGDFPFRSPSCPG
jgi:carbon-monoxide dehydrogenase large subunit